VEFLMPKPRTAAGYESAQVQRVRATCLYAATKLGDLRDELVVVGGLVPTLLIDQARPGGEKHVGTLDLDVGMTLAILDGRRYEELTARLRAAGFSPDENERGNVTRQRWRIDGPHKVTVDFLIPPSREGDVGGTLLDIEADFAAIIAPGLRLAFQDRVSVTIAGRTIRDELARRDIWVCGPGAFVVMKALAFRSRGENKDAYDLAYFLQNYGSATDEVAKRLAPLVEDEEVKRAVQILREDFAAIDSIGPRRAAEFIHGGRNDEAEADALGAVRDLLDALPA
jgi:hypothetical protein